MAHTEGLWAENAEAWSVFQLLCGRTVRDCQLESWVIARVTDGWEMERALDLVQRLDILANVLEPSHGPTENRRRS